MNASAGKTNPYLSNLFSLLVIRSCALLVQCAVLAYVVYNSRTVVNVTGLVYALLFIATLTVMSWWRLRQAWPVSDTEFLCQLLLDVLGWSVLMYLTGGANNPFISYYIVPLVISAAVLPWRHTWLVAGTSLTAYSLLLYFYLPFPLFTPHSAVGHSANGNVHIIGMWFNFLFSAGLITYFVVRMAATLRYQEARDAARREDELRNEQILAVASLAAGTAHELGTPLNTMTLLSEELLHDESLSEQARTDCKEIQNQLTQCRKILSKLSDTAEQRGLESTKEASLEIFVSRVIEQWRVRRPSVHYRVNCAQAAPYPKLTYDLTLQQAVENLLNNAADTNSKEIEIDYGWSDHELWISVRDHGPGLSAEQMSELGKPAVFSHRNGLGIGLMLSHATVTRYRGELQLRPATGGGTLALLALPRPGGGL